MFVYAIPMPTAPNLASLLKTRIAFLAEAKGWTLQELADRAQIARRTLGALEPHRTSPQTWEALAKAAGCTVEFLRDGIGEPFPTPEMRLAFAMQVRQTNPIDLSRTTRGRVSPDEIRATTDEGQKLGPATGLYLAEALDVPYEWLMGGVVNRSQKTSIDQGRLTLALEIALSQTHDAVRAAQLASQIYVAGTKKD